MAYSFTARALRCITLILLCGCSSLPAQDWQLVWADEFDAAVIDTTQWSMQFGNGCEFGICGWGNNELQWYRPENAFVEDGRLVIEVRQESYNGFDYTSARMRTLGKGDWTYGRFEMRARLPYGQGLWPAFWMLPSDNTYGGWAASGEIDIMELIGREPGTVYGTLHHGGSWPNNTHTGITYTLDQGRFADDFHVFAVEWEAGEIRWYVDDIHYQTQTEWSTTGAPFPAPFDQPFHILLNVAVGGNFPGNPDETTRFPQRMEVDYVRVYQRGD